VPPMPCPRTTIKFTNISPKHFGGYQAWDVPHLHATGYMMSKKLQQLWDDSISC